MTRLSLAASTISTEITWTSLTPRASLRSTSDMSASACTPIAYDTKHLKSYDK